MPSNARWRRFKIVDLSEQPSGQELIAGLKNALARGESLEKAKQSFLNAGYKPEEVEAASLGMSQNQPIQSQPQVAPTQPLVPQLTQQAVSVMQPPVQEEFQQVPPQPSAPQPEITPIIPVAQPAKKKFPLFITILIIIAIIDLFGAAFFILFWDKLF